MSEEALDALYVGVCDALHIGATLPSQKDKEEPKGDVYGRQRGGRGGSVKGQRGKLAKRRLRFHGGARVGVAVVREASREARRDSEGL